MRTFILALMALACLSGAVQAQQQATSTADQGKPGAAPWPVAWTGQSVFADLRVAAATVSTANPVPVAVTLGGATNASGNPLFVQVTNFPTTQSISAAALPLPAGAATAAGQSTANTSLASLDGKTPALGGQPKTASRSVTPASDLANIEPAGAAITGTSMPAGGTGITGWLSSIYQGIVGRQTFLVASSPALASGAYLGEANYIYLGASPSAYTSLVACFFSSVAGTYTVQATDGTTSYTLASGTLPASTFTPIKLPAAPVAATGTRYRAYITNGSTAAFAFASIALAAN